MPNHKRDVTIALCSLVGGVILTAGTLLTGNAPLSATTLSDIFAMRWDVRPDGVMERADALRRPGSTSLTAPASSAASAASSSTSSTPAIPVKTECAVATEIAATFTAAVDRHIPRDFESSGMREGLLGTVQRVIKDYCAIESSSSRSSVQSSAKPVD
ncbi:MAG: hypothetical protein AAB728_03185, partial [Patescibacteria group bacterium]